MLCNTKACRPLATEIYHAIIKGRRAMNPGERLTTAEICGDYWQNLDEQQQCFAYCFVSTGVELGLLGLERAGTNSRNNWLYKLA